MLNSPPRFDGDKIINSDGTYATRVSGDSTSPVGMWIMNGMYFEHCADGTFIWHSIEYIDDFTLEHMHIHTTFWYLENNYVIFYFGERVNISIDDGYLTLSHNRSDDDSRQWFGLGSYSPLILRRVS